MAYDENALRKIYNRTSGYCHICKKKLSFKNYGKIDKKSPWEVEHSRPRSRGGSDHLNNLYASCISCNKKKGTFTSRTARSWNNRRDAPLSKVKRKEAKCSNAIVGGVAGSIIIGIAGGPVGAFVGAALGGKIGYDVDPDR
jgi:5-methylcytosine-specific restriction endonuclease McrA